MSTKQLTLELDSDPRNICQVESFVENVQRQFRISQDKYGDILISVTEAVNNAIIHGNRRDRRKTVCIRILKSRNSIAFQVSDEGRGFDHNRLPDPTNPENLLKAGGRGVFLMHQLSDNIRFTDEGRTVEMQFKLR